VATGKSSEPVGRVIYVDEARHSAPACTAISCSRRTIQINRTAAGNAAHRGIDW
jgi:hypothetical protein